MSHAKRLLFIYLLSVPLAGCLGGTGVIHGVSQIGGAETKTWVFMSAQSMRASGIYRCVDTGNGRPSCVKATISE